MSIPVRSIIFNVFFYVNTTFMLFLALPTFFLPYRAIIWVATTWGRINLFMLRVICGIHIEVRGEPFRLAAGGETRDVRHRARQLLGVGLAP